MPGVENFDIEQAFNEYASATALAEAGRYKTLPTSEYTIQIVKIEGKKFPGEDRPLAHATAQVLIDGVKRGTVFFDMSWVEKRNASGKLDGAFNKYAQAAKAMFPELSPEERASKPVGEVLKMVQQYPLRAYITESYRVPQSDGSLKWTTPRTEEEATALRTTGAEVRNFVQNLGKV